MKSKKLYPECCYSIDSHISLEKLRRLGDDFVVGKVFLWKETEKSFLVNLGNSIIAAMPYSEASIYPVLRKDGRLTPEGFTLLRKTVCVRIKAVEPEIVVSRKDNMLKAFEAISLMKGEIMDATIKSTAHFAHYLDIGHGISGMLHVRDLCKSHLYHVKDIDVPQDISVQITDIDSQNLRVLVNYKNLFKDLSTSFEYGDIITVTVLQKLNEDGYFVYVNPATTAILNVPICVDLSYGTEVLAKVRKSSPGKLRLSFVALAK